MVFDLKISLSNEWVEKSGRDVTLFSVSIFFRFYEKRKLWGQPLTRDSSPMQGQAFEVSISRIYSVLLAEFGGKGTR